MEKYIAILAREVNFDEFSRALWHTACHEAAVGECHCYCRPPLGCGEDCPARDPEKAERITDLLAKFDLLDEEGEVRIPYEDPFIYRIKNDKDFEELKELSELFNFSIFEVERCSKCGMWDIADGKHECGERGWDEDWCKIIKL